MKLEVGQTIRLRKLTEKQGYCKYGKIAAIYRTYIVLQLEEYRECIMKADILNPEYHCFAVKVEGRFKEVNIDMWGE